MKFFQIQEEKQFQYRCLHITELSVNEPISQRRQNRKPYERYKDMKLAIRLIERGQNSVFKIQTNKLVKNVQASILNNFKIQDVILLKDFHQLLKNQIKQNQQLLIHLLEPVEMIFVLLLHMQNKKNQGLSQIISDQPLFQKKWLGLSSINYSIGEKIIEGYEAVYRPQRKQKGFKVDGVEVIPIITRKDQQNELVFIANYRPSVSGFCIEFPAGLIEDEDIEANAKRELEEQTGYVASKILKLPVVPLHCDPWKSSQCGPLYVGIIDGDDPKHRNQQQLDKDQNIRVFTVKFNNELADSLWKYSEENGYKIHTKVWAFCIGFNLSNFISF